MMKETELKPTQNQLTNSELEQIEEMARDICECFNNDGACYQDDKPCDCKCDSFTDAQYLYEKGYRKQSDGEWIWTENGEADCEKYWVCSVCKEHDFVKTKYCPNCGAKMKGGAE